MQGKTKPHPADQQSVARFNTLLLVLWMTMDLIATGLAISFSEGRFAELGALWAMASLFLVCGTLHCAILCVPKNSLFAVLRKIKKSDFSRLRIDRVKSRPRSILAGGLLGVALLAAAPLVYSTLPKEPDVVARRFDPPPPELAAKCSEIASLEQKLFRSDENAVLADCLIQYDEKYQRVRGIEIARK